MDPQAKKLALRALNYGLHVLTTTDGTEYGAGVHLITNINNGQYGNSNSWLSNFNLPDPNPYIGIKFSGLKSVSSIAFGRDNGNTVIDACGGTCTDRSIGTYTIQYTQVVSPGTGTTETGDASTGWVTVGFNARPGLAGTKLVMGYVAGAKVVCEEHIADPPNHRPKVEHGGHDAISEVRGREVRGVTTIDFRVELDSKDPVDVVLVPGRRYYLTMAWSHEDDLYHHSAQRTEVDVIL